MNTKKHIRNRTIMFRFNAFRLQLFTNMAFASLAFVILSSCIHLEAVSGANILVVFPFPFRSHLIAYQPLLEEILKRGHNLTLLSSATIDLNPEFQQNFTLKEVKVEKYISYLSLGK